MSVGSGVVISQVFGAKDPRRLSKAVHNTVALSLAGGLALMAIGYVIAPWFIYYLHYHKTQGQLCAVEIGEEREDRQEDEG